MTKKLNSVDMRLASHARNEHVIDVKHGTTIEDVLKPDFYNHVAAKMTQWDVIEVRAEDKSFWAKLVVVNIKDKSIVVKKAEHIDLTEKTSSEEDLEALNKDYIVKHMGGNKWCVLRKGDKKDDLVIKNLQTEAEAKEARTKHLQEIAA